jgi:hypothetical protein
LLDQFRGGRSMTFCYFSKLVDGTPEAAKNKDKHCFRIDVDKLNNTGNFRYILTGLPYSRNVELEPCELLACADKVLIEPNKYFREDIPCLAIYSSNGLIPPDCIAPED